MPKRGRSGEKLVALNCAKTFDAAIGIVKKSVGKGKLFGRQSSGKCRFENEDSVILR
jgi:hypothetical protein